MVEIVDILNYTYSGAENICCPARSEHKDSDSNPILGEVKIF